MTIKTALCLALIFSTSTVSAQSVETANMVSATPAVARDESGISSCGINFMVTSLVDGAPAVLYDFSMNIYSSYMGLVKVGSHNVRYRGKNSGWDLDNMKIRLPAPKSFWIATRDDRVSIRPDKYFPAESKGFVIGAAEIEKVMELLQATASGEPIQVSTEYAGDRIHRVTGFRANMSQDDRDTVQACFDGILKRMKNEVPK